MKLTSGLAMAAALICFVFLILSHASIANAAAIMSGNRGSGDNACAERMMAEEFVIDLMNQTQPQLVEINEICEGCTVYKIERELPTMMDNYDMVIKDGAMADGKVATHGDGLYDGKSEESVGWGSTGIGR